MNKVYEIITDRIIALLEKGAVPWHRPWGGADGMPKNLVSGKEYRGINVFMLHSGGYSSPYWVSYKQAIDLHGHVKKGEKGFPCVFWNWMDKEDDESGKTVKRPFLRYYTVFNVLQCEGVKYPDNCSIRHPFSPIQACEDVLGKMPGKPGIHHGGNVACYSPGKDVVSMPAPETFDRPESYYSVLFHELTHSTGHKSRLDRPGITEAISFGSTNYSKEELIAEMGAAFLAGHAGIEQNTLDNSAAYIQGWLGKLRNDKALVVQAAAQAQKATDWILDRKWNESE